MWNLPLVVVARLRGAACVLVLLAAACDSGTPAVRVIPSAPGAAADVRPPVSAMPLPDGACRLRVVRDAGAAGEPDAAATPRGVADATVRAWRVPADDAVRDGLLARDGLPPRADVEVRTSADGVATVPLPAALGEAWLVTVAADGLRPWSGVIASAAEAPDRVELSADAAPWRVVVVDETGRAVPGATVLASDPFALPHAVGTAGPDGVIERMSVRLDGDDIHGGDRLVARGPGRVGDEVVLDADRRTAMVSIRPQLLFAGRVVGADGRPVAGARVTDLDGAADVTDADGRFRLDATLSWAAGAWAELDVTADGALPATVRCVPGDERIEVALRRDEKVRVVGRVELPDGSPPPVARVEGEPVGPGGVFDIEVDAGRVRLQAEGDWFPGAPSNVAGRAGSAEIDADPAHPPRDVRIVLDRERSVLHARFATLRAALWFRDGNGWRWMVPDDESCEVRTVVELEPGAEAEAVVSAGIDGPTESLVATRIRTRGTWGGTAEPVAGPEPPPLFGRPGDDVDESIPTGTVAGRIVLGPEAEASDLGAGAQRHGGDPRPDDPGAPPSPGRSADDRAAAGARPRLRPPATIVAVMSADLAVEFASCECAPGESFGLEEVPVGRHRLLVSGGGWRAVADVTVREDATTEMGDVVALPPRVVRGRVVDPDGRPLGGAVVAWEIGDSEHREETVSRGDGAFVFEGGVLAAGRLVTSRPGYGEDVRDWRGVRDGVEIRLARGATLRLVGLPGVWCDGVEVVTAAGRSTLVIPELTREGDAWTVADLSAGRVWIEAPGRPAVEADLRPGATTEVRVPDPK